MQQDKKTNFKTKSKNKHLKNIKSMNVSHRVQDHLSFSSWMPFRIIKTAGVYNRFLTKTEGDSDRSKNKFNECVRHIANTRRNTANTKTAGVSHISVIAVFLLFILSSCSTTKSTWDCPMEDGAGCRTIYEADHDTDINCKTKKCKKNQKKQSKKYIYRKTFVKHIKETENTKKEKNTATYSNNQKSNSMDLKSLRTNEKVTRVVFAPFIDEYGNRHEQSTVYIVDEQPNWRN
ncbi:type IV conjugative transfer system lipoprotein TraV [Pseudomonadota bacterium]